MKVLIQTLDRNIVDVTVEDSGTVLDLKNSIHEVKNHPIDQMTIIFNGKKLDDNNKALSDYAVVDGTRVVLMLHKQKPATSTVTLPTIPSTVPTLTPVSPTQETPEQVSDPVDSDDLASLTPSVPSVSLPSSNVATASGTPIGSFSQMFQQNPQLLAQLLMSNPQISQMAQENPEAFAQIMNDPNFLSNIIQMGEGFEEEYDDEDEQLYEKIFQGDAGLTEEQKKEVEVITNMGLGSYEDTIQLYVAYGHNKDATVNALLDEKFNS